VRAAKLVAFACGPVALAAALAAGPRAFGADLQAVRQQLTRDVQTAQRDLSAAQASISRERGDLAQRINTAQNRVLDLRQKTVAARRLADEDTLTLNQIQKRLDDWQQQSRFQTRLVAGFLDRAGQAADTGGIDLRAGLELLGGYLDEEDGKLHPGWRDGPLALPNGQIVAANLLALGPVEWFRRADPSESGLVKTEQNMARVSLEFGGSAATGIQDLYRSSTGLVTFDPTLTRALLLAEDRDTPWQYLRKGGIWVIPILLFAVFATVTATLKAVSLYRLPALVPALAQRAEAALAQGRDAIEALTGTLRGPQAELLAIALAGRTTEQRDDRLYAALLEERNRLERWLGAIAITASVSPLLGLLGTVSGMIATFKLMTLFGAGDPNAVSSGISEALITTELGLVVAIPALLAHALMSRKVKSYFAQIENDAVHLSQLPVPAESA
jgi:biopolymer transport protein ExbB